MGHEVLRSQVLELPREFKPVPLHIPDPKSDPSDDVQRYSQTGKSDAMAHTIKRIQRAIAADTVRVVEAGEYRK